MYCQDGEEFFNFGRIATWANQLILEEGVEPFIIVGVEVNTKVRTEEYAPFGNRFDAYLSCFAEEIIPFVEQNILCAKSLPKEYSPATPWRKRIRASGLALPASLHPNHQLVRRLL